MHVVMKLISPIAKIYMYRDDEEEFVIFQQDGASTHHSKKVQDWLDIIFEDRWMGRAGPISWSARSPDLTPLAMGHMYQSLLHRCLCFSFISIQDYGRQNLAFLAKISLLGLVYPLVSLNKFLPASYQT